MKICKWLTSTATYAESDKERKEGRAEVLPPAANSLRTTSSANASPTDTQNRRRRDVHGIFIRIYRSFRRHCRQTEENNEGRKVTRREGKERKDGNVSRYGDEPEKEGARAGGELSAMEGEGKGVDGWGAMGKRGSRTRRNAANPNRTTRSAEYPRAARAQKESKPATRAMRRKWRKRVVKERTPNKGGSTGVDGWGGRRRKEGKKVPPRVEVGRGGTTERRCGVMEDERNVWSGEGVSGGEGTGEGREKKGTDGVRERGRACGRKGGSAQRRRDWRDAGVGEGGVWLEAATEGRKVRREGRSSADDVADARQVRREGGRGGRGGGNE
ncbi:hypothetical protein C8J57DRAFT_1576479 [Mycena rebaudengoi]|nr:hypothetical protein C8J57DRAFT_1576479 [Mycena rebaudengoi]